MKSIIQRVSSASVSVDDADVASIDAGFLVLLGVAKGDTEADADYLARKISALRVFSDNSGKMNLSVAEVGGSVLAVSQFTLCADTRKGNRPGFDRAAPPDEGRRLFEYFVRRLESHGGVVKTGVFGAHMHVSLVNDGPVTIIIDSAEKGQGGT